MRQQSTAINESEDKEHTSTSQARDKVLVVALPVPPYF